MATKQDVSGYLSYELKIGSQLYKSSAPLISLYTHFEVNKIPSATIYLIDGDPATKNFDLSSESFMNPGESVKISMGRKGKNKVIFSGIMVGHSIQFSNIRGTYLRIDCKHDSCKMITGRKIKYFEKKDDKAIITELFKVNGVTAPKIKGSFVKHDSFLQYDITDWDLMLTRCEANSKVVVFNTDEVNIEDPKISGAPSAKFTFGMDIIEFESEFNAQNQLSKVESHSWDSEKQKILSSIGKPSTFKQLENKGVKSSDLSKKIAPKTYELFHGAEISKAELDSWSHAQLTKASLSKVQGRLRVTGNNDLMTGQVIEIDGVGEKFSGKVYISAIKHSYDDQGWFTDIQFGLSNPWFIEKPNVNSMQAGGLVSAVHGLQIGKVLKIDGDDQHRVQLSLPIGGTKVKLWARLAFDDAGNERGVVFWPEKDDEVIVGFLNDDPRHPIILGSVYSKKNAPPIKPDPKNPEKGIITRSKVKFIINDKDKSVQIETPGGNSILIDDKKKIISVTDENKNSIKMQKKGITIDSKGDITLNAAKNLNIKAKSKILIEGMDVTNKAKGKLVAQGAGGVHLKSNGIASIKGSVVKIN